MPANDYRFVTIWRVRGTPEKISEILEDALGMPLWWPDVYLNVREVEAGVFRLHTKGWLPYRLNWFVKQTESRRPYGFSVKAWGDLQGTGVWTFKPDGEYTDIQYDWCILARKPLLRYLSPLLRPVFAFNHRWAMERGEEGLKNELAHRSNLNSQQAGCVAPGDLAEDIGGGQ